MKSTHQPNHTHTAVDFDCNPPTPTPTPCMFTTPTDYPKPRYTRLSEDIN